MLAAKLEDQLCFALYSASSHLTCLYRPLLDELDLTYTQFLVMMALWEKDNVSISELAKTASLSKATMTPLIKRLEHKGFIKSKRPIDNERQKNIILTKKGKGLSEQSLGVSKKVFKQTGLTKQQANDLMSLCSKITKDKKK